MVSEHFDVLVVGAGLSGVGAGCRLRMLCPGKSFAILEGRSDLGGTWDLFRYPGIRSDSDMFTLGYPFRPWDQPRSIADGASILRYIKATAAEFGVDRHIRFDQRVRTASWSSSGTRWTVGVDRGGAGDHVEYTCDFLYLCSGYYSYEGGYLPEFPGAHRFRGPVVHPQAWPEDLDYAGKRVVVIGSGATAVTLVPALAETAAHVTMLQRSPSYVVSLPGVDPLAGRLRRWLPEGAANHVSRWKNVALSTAFYQFCRRRPAAARKLLRAGLQRALPGYPVERDFSPRYDPWDQRLCVVPDGDLFAAIRDGRASVVTDTIRTFTETGIELHSGAHLDADIIVAATGLQLVACGGVRIDLDAVEVDLGDRFVYRGLMLSGVPNLAMCVGYTNASWTLRADLTSQYVCRLLNHLDKVGAAVAVPERAAGLEARPLLDLTSGYVQRAVDRFPKQGTADPWLLRQNYVLDFVTARFGDINESMQFLPAPAPAGRAGGGATPAPAAVEGAGGAGETQREPARV